MSYKAYLALDILVTDEEKKQLLEMQNSGVESMDSLGRIMVPGSIEQRIYKIKPHIRDVNNVVILYDLKLERFELAFY